MHPKMTSMLCQADIEHTRLILHVVHSVRQISALYKFYLLTYILHSRPMRYHSSPLHFAERSSWHSHRCCLCHWTTMKTLNDRILHRVSHSVQQQQNCHCLFLIMTCYVHPATDYKTTIYNQMTTHVVTHWSTLLCYWSTWWVSSVLLAGIC